MNDRRWFARPCDGLVQRIAELGASFCTTHIANGTNTLKAEGAHRKVWITDRAGSIIDAWTPVEVAEFFSGISAEDLIGLPKGNVLRISTGKADGSYRSRGVVIAAFADEEA